MKPGDEIFGWKVICADPDRDRHWICRCKCGELRSVQGSKLASGRWKSCGCIFPGRQLSEDERRMRKIWTGIIHRCRSETHPSYQNYGGRGIKVCDEWADSFERFLLDVGVPDDASLSLDRIDNDGDYRPGNVRWATRVQQGRNKRTNRLVTVNGETKTVAEWAELMGCNKMVIYSRLDRGWSEEDAVLVPVAKWGRNRSAQAAK